VVVEEPVRSSISEKLRQWELAGGNVCIARLSQTEAVVELCTCTGELMERFSSGDQTVLDDLSSRVLIAGLEDSIERVGKSAGGEREWPVGRTLVGCPPCRHPQKPACTSSASFSVPSVP
jgi:hypothetical protein